MSGVQVSVVRIDGHRVLTYRYDVNRDLGFKFHLLSEVGRPWQPEAEEKARVIAEKHGCTIEQVELDRRPWYVDALIKKEN